MNVYVTEHDICKVVSEAFAKGCGGQLVPARRLLPGDAACYGILRGCGDIIKQCRMIGRTFWHIDLGYFRRGHYSGYYRVTKNGFQDCGKGERPFDRLEKLKIDVKPWRKTGKTVVVSPPTTNFGEFLGINPETWTDLAVSEVQKQTDRPVEVSTKQNPAHLDDAWCVVTHQSNLAVDALMLGIPVIVTGESAAKCLAWRFEDIESPKWPDGREQWAANLAYKQFTLEEFRDGTAWALLQ